MTVFDDYGRPEPEPAVDEFETLSGFLEYQRATFRWKCEGLDAAGMNATTASSSMTLGGMMKHIALVEDWWFSQWLLDLPKASIWDNPAIEADPDWDWHSAKDDTPETLRELWEASLVRARSSVATAMADGGLGRLSNRIWKDGRTPNLRWIMTHMIEEYARHNGHADLLRESIDGVTGE